MNKKNFVWMFVFLLLVVNVSAYDNNVVFESFELNIANWTNYGDGALVRNTRSVFTGSYGGEANSSYLGGSYVNNSYARYPLYNVSISGYYNIGADGVSVLMMNDTTGNNSYRIALSNNQVPDIYLIKNGVWIGTFPGSQNSSGTQTKAYNWYYVVMNISFENNKNVFRLYTYNATTKVLIDSWNVSNTSVSYNNKMYIGISTANGGKTDRCYQDNVSMSETGLSYAPITFFSPSDSANSLKYMPYNFVQVNVTTNLSGFNYSRLNVYVGDGNCDGGGGWNALYVFDTTSTSQFWNISGSNISFNVGTKVCYNLKVNNLTNYIMSGNYSNISLDYAKLNVTAVNHTGSLINSFTYILDGVSYSTSNGFVLANITLGQSYSSSIDAAGYAFDYYNFTANQSSVQFKNFTLYPFNSLFIQAYLNNFSTPYLNPNVTVRLDDSGINHYTAFSNSSGGIVFYNISSSTYVLSYSTPLFIARQKVVTVSNGSSQFVSILFENATQIIFNFKDTGGNTLPSVFCSLSQFYNGSLFSVQSAFADGSGRIQFLMNTNAFYLLNCSLAGYISYGEVYNPVYFTSYTITLKATSSANVTPTGFAYFSPTGFFNGQNDSFNIRFVSPFNNFVYYNYSFTTPSGTTFGSGSNSSGQYFNSSFYLVNSSNPQFVSLMYNFVLDDGSSFSQSFSWLTVIPWMDKTLSNMKTKRYGMLVGDRVLLFTIILIPFIGVLFLGGSLTVALLGGGLLIWLFTKNGFLGSDGSGTFLIPSIIIVLYVLFRAWYNR